MQRIHNEDQSVESMIQAAGKTAPRITPADIAANIRSEHYFTASEGSFGAVALPIVMGGDDISLDDESNGKKGPLDLLTFCVLILQNGFTVTGESACASPENFNAEIGKKVARDNAVQKIWSLMGYALKNQLHQEQTNGT